jgi:hypothetical protein
MAEDGGSSPKWALTEINVEIDVQEWSGSAPIFPLPLYRKFVVESARNGTELLRVKATSKVGVRDKNWRYAIVNNDEVRSLIFMKVFLRFPKF